LEKNNVAKKEKRNETMKEQEMVIFGTIIEQDGKSSSMEQTQDIGDVAAVAHILVSILASGACSVVCSSFYC